VTLISDAYREQNALYHRAMPGYGASRHALRPVLNLIDEFKPASILDYGCGKGALGAALMEVSDVPYRGYDPAIPMCSATPEPADLVICRDVIEHVEPEYLDATIDELHRLTKVALYMVVATKLSTDILPDGRNAHLIVQPINWWREKFARRFKIKFKADHEGKGIEATFLLTP
jgi:ribosomal protein RSM22 (predicted rRNA methylase)